MLLGSRTTGGFLSSGYSVKNLSEGWHHLAVTSESPAGLKYYVDGALVGSNASLLSSSQMRWFGNYSSSSSEAFGLLMNMPRIQLL